MSVAQSAFTHIRELDCSLAAGIHEPVAALRMEFGGGYDLGELFHICGLDVDNIETLVLYVEVPQVYPQVVAGDECFSIAVHRDAVDVICVGVGIGPARHSSHDSIVVCHPRQLQFSGILECGMVSLRRPSSACTGRGHLVGQIVLGDHL